MNRYLVSYVTVSHHQCSYAQVGEMAVGGSLDEGSVEAEGSHYHPIVLKVLRLRPCTSFPFPFRSQKDLAHMQHDKFLRQCCPIALMSDGVKDRKEVRGHIVRPPKGRPLDSWSPLSHRQTAQFRLSADALRIAHLAKI